MKVTQDFSYNFRFLVRPSRVRISARGLPIVWSEGQQITLEYCIKNVLKIPTSVGCKSIFFVFSRQCYSTLYSTCRVYYLDPDM